MIRRTNLGHYKWLLGTKIRTTEKIVRHQTKRCNDTLLSKVGVINGDKMITSKVQEYEYVVLF